MRERYNLKNFLLMTTIHDQLEQNIYLGADNLFIMKTLVQLHASISFCKTTVSALWGRVLNFFAIIRFQLSINVAFTQSIIDLKRNNQIYI